LDAKGRFLLPTKLRKQFPEDAQAEFVINRGIEKCLVLHPQKVWEAQIEKIFSKNQFIEKNRRFARRFTNGATEIELDGSARINLPKRLMEYAGMDKDIILVGQYNKVEIWDEERYDAMMNMDDDDDIALLAEEVMKDLNFGVPVAMAEAKLPSGSTPNENASGESA
jgi:MraZ protein